MAGPDSSTWRRAETRVCSGGAERDSRSERSAPAAAFPPLRCIDISGRSSLESEMMAAGPLSSEGDSKQREEQFDLRAWARFSFLFGFLDGRIMLAACCATSFSLFYKISSLALK